MCKHNIEIMTKVAKKSLGKELRNSQGLRKVVAIYNTKNLILYKKCQIPYSKSSCFRIIFFSQLIKYSQFLLSL